MHATMKLRDNSACIETSINPKIWMARMKCCQFIETCAETVAEIILLCDHSEGNPFRLLYLLKGLLKNGVGYERL